MVIVAILLEGNTQNIFYGGQIVAGNVHVELTERIKARGVRLEINGLAHVYWTEHHTRTDSKGHTHTDTRTYTGNETYMSFILQLTPLESSGAEIYLEPGVHKYPFSFQLPPTLPSTYHGEHGSVTYKLKAVVDRKMKFDDQAEIEITVLRLLDLNLESPHLREPLVLAIQNLQQSCCFSCCIKGVPQIKMTVNRGCFVAGETMVVGVQVENNTNTKIDSIVVDFIQRKEFWANHSGGGNYRCKPVVTTLGSVPKPAVDSGQTQNLDDTIFNIPAVEASRLDGCSIINIIYYIQLKVNFDKCCASGSATQEIIIGNIPLHMNTVTTQPQGYAPFTVSVGPNKI